MSDTPTPRTDTVCDRFSRGLMGSGEVRAFMEQLERELAAANERIRRLVEAGDEIAFRLRESVFTEDEVAIEEWDHAKEAKP